MDPTQIRGMGLQNIPEFFQICLPFGCAKFINLLYPLKARLLKYENIQSICSLEKYHRVHPTEDELAGLK